jgi:hypothetical protein
MHPLSSAAYQASMGYPGMDAGGQQQSPPEAGSPNTHHDPTNGGGDQNGPPSNYTDINQILDQILNITDQSLDEAQVRDLKMKIQNDIATIQTQPLPIIQLG